MSASNPCDSSNDVIPGQTIISMYDMLSAFPYIKFRFNRLYHWKYKKPTLQWCHNGQGDVSNHQPRDCLLNRLYRHRSKKTSKLRVAGVCAGNSLVTSECHAQKTSNAENVSIWWHHHEWSGFPFGWVSTAFIEVQRPDIIHAQRQLNHL